MSRRRFLIIIVLGLPALATLGLRLRLVPPVRDNSVVVTIERASSFAEQIEREITIPLEDQIAILDGVSAIHSHSIRGKSSLEVYFDPLVTPQASYIRVRAAVERIEHLLPGDATRPRLEHRLAGTRPLFIVALTTASGLDFAEVGRTFGAVEGSGRVTIGGDTKPELVVEISPRTLAGAGVSIETIVRALQSDAVRGGFGPPQGQVFTLGNAYRDSDYLRALGIDAVELGQVAAIEERMSQPETISRVNAQQRVVLSIYPTDDTHPVRLSRALRRQAARYSSAEILYDYGRQIERTLGRGLLALVVAAAAVAIGLRYPMRAAMPPVLLLFLAAGLAAMAATRVAAFDLVSLLGMVAALSLIPDLYLHHRPYPAAHSQPDGTPRPNPQTRVVSAALFHTALLGGLVGLGMLAPSTRALWTAVLLPALAASLATGTIGWLYRSRTLSPQGGTDPQMPLRGTARRRITLLLVAGAMAVLGGMAQMELRPLGTDDERALFFRVIFREGFAATLEATRPLEEALTTLDGVRFVSALHTRASVRFYVDLARRGVGTAARQLVRRQMRRIPEAFVLFADTTGQAQRLHLTLRGDDPLRLRAVAGELGAAIAALDGVQEVIADFTTAASALALRLDLQRLGSISPRQVHSALYWTLARPIAAKRHTSAGEGDIRIVVPHSQRATLQDIMRLPIVAPDGEKSEIGALVSVGEQPRVDSIRRIDRRRSVTLAIGTNRATKIDRLRAHIEVLIAAHIAAQPDPVGTGAELEFVLQGAADPAAGQTNGPLSGWLSRQMLLAVATMVVWSLLLLRLDDQLRALHTLSIALCAALPATLFYLFRPIALSALVGLLTAFVALLGTLPQLLGRLNRRALLRSALIWLLWMAPLAAIDAPLLAPFALTALSVRATAVLLALVFNGKRHPRPTYRCGVAVAPVRCSAERAARGANTCSAAQANH